MNGSGAATISSLSIPATTEGSHSVWAIGGNGSAASVTIVVDTTAPTASMGRSPAANGNGWHTTSPVQLTLTGNDGSGSGISQLRYTTDGTDNVWHHVAFTRQAGGELALYVDGAAQGTVTGPSAARDGNSIVRFGRSAADNQGNAYAGSLDEVALYSTALHADGVLARYNLGKGLG